MSHWEALPKTSPKEFPMKQRQDSLTPLKLLCDNGEVTLWVDEKEGEGKVF
jgi:hypothetical protein